MDDYFETHDSDDLMEWENEQVFQDEVLEKQEAWRSVDDAVKYFHAHNTAYALYDLIRGHEDAIATADKESIEGGTFDIDLWTQARNIWEDYCESL